MTRKLTETSKFLSYVLRHAPEAIGLKLDSEGWADVDELIAGAARDNRELTLELIRNVVADNDKKRFAFSADGLRIRAVQGHSTDSVAIQHIPRVPPEVLYHGTATRFLDSILAQGLLPGQRHHVHLAQDIATALAVGKRYGEPVLLRIEAGKLHEQGLAFFQADNGVWLTAHVPVNHLVVVKD